MEICSDNGVVVNLNTIRNTYNRIEINLEKSESSKKQNRKVKMNVWNSNMKQKVIIYCSLEEN